MIPAAYSPEETTEINSKPVNPEANNTEEEKKISRVEIGTKMIIYSNK